MNRLNNINREGIYPVTKETLLAIEDNFQMIGRVLYGLKLPKRTAVILTGATQGVSYMFLYHGNVKYEIVKVVGTGLLVPQEQQSSVANLRLNPTNFVLTSSDNKTTIIGTDGVTEYADCIVEERYTLTYSAGGNTVWKYYALEDVLGLRKDSIGNEMFTLPSSSWTIARNSSFVRPMIGQKHFHIDLEISSPATSLLVQGETRITIGGDIVDSINALLGTSGTYTHPLQGSALGFVASGYITQDYGDTEANIVCYKSSVINNTPAQKIQIAGDIWL